MNIYATIGISIFYIAAIILIPQMITRLPADYFMNENRETCFWRGDSQFIKGILISLKNLIGAILLITGIAMIFLPGQGVLTIVAGLLLMNFPYKYKLEKWLMSKPIVMNAFNKVRQKENKEPFKLQ